MAVKPLCHDHHATSTRDDLDRGPISMIAERIKKKA